MLLAFIPMLFIAIGYQQLNRPMPDCGTTFTWGTKAFGPKIGWMGGWGIIAADVIVMANLAQIAASYMFTLFGAYGLAASKWWTLAGRRGLDHRHVPPSATSASRSAASIQYGLLGIELVMLVILQHHRPRQGVRRQRPAGIDPPGLVVVQPLPPHVLGPDLGDAGRHLHLLGLGHGRVGRTRRPGTRAGRRDGRGHLDGRAAGDLRAGDRGGPGLSPASATRASGWTTRTTPGTCCPSSATASSGPTASAWFLAKLLVLMVLSSAAASTLTTILPTARTTLSMAAYRSIPAKFARIHPRYLTPTWSTVGMALASIGFYVLHDPRQRERPGRHHLAPSA